MNRRFQNNERIGDYRVVGFIGQGGMGEVYHFYHEKLNRSVAVKVLGAQVGLDENYKSRFLNEARVQASLHHPNIATLYDFQEVGNELLIFMELVDGESLENLISRGFYSTEESLKVFQSIVEAINYIHLYGVIHRDIKAENVKINSAGIPKLLDFGIAKDPKSQALTQIGGVIGTPNYLAPEQLIGKPASEQTDVWALGVLLYRMLTSKFPFEHESFEALILQITAAQFEPPEKLNSSLPKAVAEIVKKCLAKDLSQRYQTTEELLQDVRRVLSERYSKQYSATAKTEKQFPLAAFSWVTVSVFLLISLVSLGIWAISGTSPTANLKNPVNKDTAENLNKNAKVQPKVIPTVAQTNKKSETISLQSGSGSSKTTIKIDVIGGSAEIWRNDEKIGDTPFDLEVTEKEIVNLTLKRQGFADSDEKIEASAGKKVYTFSLSPK